MGREPFGLFERGKGKLLRATLSYYTELLFCKRDDDLVFGNYLFIYFFWKEKI